MYFSQVGTRFSSQVHIKAWLIRNIKKNKSKNMKISKNDNKIISYENNQAKKNR